MNRRLQRARNRLPAVGYVNTHEIGKTRVSRLPTSPGLAQLHVAELVCVCVCVCNQRQASLQLRPVNEQSGVHFLVSGYGLLVLRSALQVCAAAASASGSVCVQLGELDGLRDARLCDCLALSLSRALSCDSMPTFGTCPVASWWCAPSRVTAAITPASVGWRRREWGSS